MKEGRKKLDLTLKVTDRLVRLSAVAVAYTENGPELTVRMFRDWARDTGKILNQNFGAEKVKGFDRLKKPSRSNSTPDNITECAKEHADYLQEMVKEMTE